jgi:hypothetical protein
MGCQSEQVRLESAKDDKLLSLSFAVNARDQPAAIAVHFGAGCLQRGHSSA